MRFIAAVREKYFGDKESVLENKKNLLGHFAALFTIFIWGTTYVSTKVLLVDFAPIDILFLRFLMGFAVLFCLSPRRIRGLGRRQEMMFAAAGLSGVTLYFLCENIALVYTYASNVGIIVSVAPFFTALLAAWLLRGERMRWTFFLGFIVALLGICLIFFNGAANLQLNPLGDFLAVLAAFIWAVYSVLTRKIAGYGISSIAATRHIFFYGLLFMLPALYIFDFHWGLQRLTNLVNLGNLLFLGLGASALCFATWTFSVKVLGAVRTSVYIYLAPVITTICSVIVLHEKITGMAVIGILLALTGLLLSQGLPLGKKMRRQD